MSQIRTERFSAATEAEKSGDHRGDFDRDCDRILYSGAFRRLAVITQVVSPAGGHAVHNRLTHVLKVAQVGKRIAERLVTVENRDLIEQLGGLSPAVVEAAGMAHDLGHPPFGHIAEEELDAALRHEGESDGYEGNAQSFRIVTRLEIRESGRNEGGPLGLNLTRATLNGMLKYPWLRPEASKPHQKFGAYQSERKQFEFARQHFKDTRRSLEAEIMDWADDISYAVHDLEDFYRAGKIPLDRLTTSKAEMNAFLEGMKRRLKANIKPEDEEAYVDTAVRFLSFSPVSEPYTGRRTQRAALRGMTSRIIHRAICGSSISEAGLVRPVGVDREVSVLKQLTWHYVIEDPRLATEQHGRRKVIQSLFQIFGNAASSEREWKLFPEAFQEQLQDKACSHARTAADYIASLGEERAVDLHSELLGLTAGRPM